jgi:hypothetical protein
MARYILIDNASGYIFADSADLNGGVVTGTPIEVARAHDECIGEFGREYEEVSRLASNETGYRCYRADVGGSEAVPVVIDGQDDEIIEAVERDCQWTCCIKVTRETK